MGSVAVSKNGVLVYTRAIGFVDVENKVNTTPNFKYRIGSISKSFTAVMVLKAVEAQKLSLDQTIDKWYPEIKNANKITLKHLLSHRSGIHNFTDDKEFLSYNTQAKTEKEMLQIITKKGNTLIAQGTGQSALAFEATAKDKFRFKDAGAEFELNPVDKTLVLLQNGNKILFSRE